MTPKQKLVALFLLMAFAGIWKADNIIRAIRENPELADVIEHNEKISEGLTRNQKTQVVIINNLGEGYVEYNDSTYDADDYKDGIIKYQNHNDIIPVYIDDMFLILQYDFENQKIQLIQRGQEPFWASTEWLGHEERSRLKEITSLSIEQQTVALKMIHLSCKIKNGKVQEAVVQRLEQSARTESKKFADAIQMDIQPKPSMPEQHSLLDMIENSED